MKNQPHKINGQINEKAIRKEDVAFMSDVDAAIHRKGHTMAYLLSLAVCLMILIFVIWAKNAVLDEVTRGVGQAIPSQHVQVIQNLEGGILEAILVADNQIVEKGDVLVRLDNTVAASQFRDAFAKSLEHEAAIARLEAEANQTEITFPEIVMENDPQIATDQRVIFKAHNKQLELEINILRSEYDQKIQEIEEIKGRRIELQKNLELAVEQKDIAEPLMKKGLYSKVDFIKLKRDVVRLRGEVNTLGRSLPRLTQEADEFQKKIEQRRAEFT